VTIASESRRQAARPALLLFLSSPIIDFLEELVVLPDLRVVRVELQRLLVGLARLVELAFVFVPDRQIVVRRNVGGVELRGLFPAVNRLAPEAALGDVDAEFDLRARVASCVGVRLRGGQHRRARNQRDREAFHEWLPATIPYLPAKLSKRCATARAR